MVHSGQKASALLRRPRCWGSRVRCCFRVTHAHMIANTVKCSWKSTFLLYTCTFQHVPSYSKLWQYVPLGRNKSDCNSAANNLAQHVSESLGRGSFYLGYFDDLCCMPMRHKRVNVRSACSSACKRKHFGFNLVCSSPVSKRAVSLSVSTVYLPSSSVHSTVCQLFCLSGWKCIRLFFCLTICQSALFYFCLVSCLLSVWLPLCLSVWLPVCLIA